MAEHSGPSDHRPSWEAGYDPWLRRWQTADFGAPSGGYVTCLFCGAETLKRSVSDLADDTGRLTVYCDNMDGEASEIEVLVPRDSAGARKRADVRALIAVDLGTATTVEREPRPKLVAAKWKSDEEGDRDRAW